MKYLALLTLLLTGCGAHVLKNGNRLNMHEKVGLMATMVVVEETDASGCYRGHKVYMGPGFLPVIARAAAPIIAADVDRDGDINVQQRVNGGSGPPNINITNPPHFIPPGHLR